MKKQDKMVEVMRLQLKLNSIGLTEAEENNYCKLNSELTGFPEKMFTKEYIDKLDDIISKSDKLINKYK